MAYVSMRPTAFHVYRKPEPRPVQRIPAYVPTADEIRKESWQLFYGQLLHDGHTNDEASELTIKHFAIADHALIGAIRNEE